MSDADGERADSLDGWVAVKPDAFDDSERYKLKFIVEWNEIESKFAVTCHNRTLQRRGDARGSCAGLFSGEFLGHVHAQLSAVRDELAPLFPDLTRFRERGLWELLFSSAPRHDADAPCRQLERYFVSAVDACGRRIVLDALFSVSEEDEREYYENLHEFKRNAMRDEITRAKDALRAIVQSHCSADGLVQLMKIYEEEDEAYRELVSVATQFNQNLLQPFRDMRELATLYKTEIQKCLEYEEFGPKRVCELEAEMKTWQQRGQTAVHSIQNITAEYFRETSKAVTGMVKQMEADQKRFGQASWAMATPRQERLRLLLAKETLQHMRAKEMCIKRKRRDIRDKMRSVVECVTESAGVVSALELQFYETQLELHDCRFEILRNEELLLLTEIQSIQRNMRELQEQVVYYDTCEDPDQLQDVEVDVSPSHSHLQQRLKHLERQRGTISSRRAYLRNQRELCVQAHMQQQRSVLQKSEQHRQHHTAQLKREKRRAEEQQMKQWVENEREKTLNRLRCFRARNQGQYVIKTQAHLRPASHDSNNDDLQPLSIISVGQQSSTPCRKGRGPKPCDIPVEVMLPGGAAVAKLDQTPPPQAPPPPPPAPPLPPPPLNLAPPINKKPPNRNTLEQNTGCMDELLASLQRGQKQLRKVTTPTEPVDVRDSIMSAIRQGVTLKKVTPSAGPAPSTDSELEKSIKAAMLRMKKVSNDSDEENSPSGDWDS